MKLIKITKAWINAYRKNENFEPIAKKRLEICSSCPHKQKMDDGALAKFVNVTEGKKTKTPVYKCNLCGCPIAKKIYGIWESCPDAPKRW